MQRGSEGSSGGSKGQGALEASRLSGEGGREKLRDQVRYQGGKGVRRPVDSDSQKRGSLWEATRRLGSMEAQG